MLVSYKWLQEYVAIPWGPDELARRLTMSGLEVEAVTPFTGDLSGVYVGSVLAAEQHPESDHLKLCQVDVGAQGTYQIICGAPNVAAGQRVAVALEGAKLPGGLEIRSTRIRGVLSRGMICSQAELGISDDHSGIWVLPKEFTPGAALSAEADLDDVILDISVYANRPDCMSVLGIAREIAALTGGELSLPPVDYIELDTSITEFTSVTVEDQERCPRYTAALLEGVVLGESPLWMQLRLRASGMRPINNIVDITNYVMLETGQPLHAFDFEQLEERRLVVRTAKPGEDMVTLDGERRKLNSEMLLICDAQNPKCIAGVMGGLDSEVTASTTRILLETANFSAVSIRRTSRALGLSSESAARFEKGINPEGTVFASKRARRLMQTLAQARIHRGEIDLNSVPAELTTLHFELAEVQRILGVFVEPGIIGGILERLGFEISVQDENYWEVTVPAHRRDVELSADLIEEIVRIWGLENLPSTLPADTSGSGGQGRSLIVAQMLREVLVGAGLQEALSYSFGRADNNERLRRPEQPMILLQNPISEDLIALRHSLLPGLLGAVSLNAHRQQNRAALFEIGPNYLANPAPQERPVEELQLAMVLWGRRHPLNWGLIDQDYDFYDLKGILEALLPESEQLSWHRGNDPSYHPGRQGLVRLNGEKVLVYGEIHPAVLRNFKIPGRVYAAEIRLEQLLELYERRVEFQELPKYPAVDRDLALVVNAAQPVGELLALLQELGGEFLQEVTVFDVYAGKPIPDGKKSVAFALRFQGARTLTDEEVNRTLRRCLEGLQTSFGAEIREQEKSS